MARAGSIALLALAYLVAAKLGLKLALVNQYATAVWPPAGIALTALLLWGYRLWPGILISAFLANVTTGDTITLSGTLASLGIAAGNTLEALLGAHLVNRFAGGRQAFERARDVFRFAALAALASTTVSATFGITSLALAGLAKWADASGIWVTWWIGDAVGDLVFAPALILWAQDWRLRWSRAHAFEAGLVLLALCALALASFTNLLTPHQPAHLGSAFLCTPALLWAAFRFGQRESAATLLLVSGFAIWGWLQGMVSEELSPPYVLLELQAYFGVTSVTMLAVAAEVSQRRQHAQALRDAEQKLRALVETSPLAMLKLDTAGKVVLANDSARRLLGFEREPLEGQEIAPYLPILANTVRNAAALPSLRTSVECRAQRKSGEVFLAHIWFSTYDIGGNRRLAAVIWDASEYVRDREGAGLESLLATSRLLIGALSHEIRNLTAATASAYHRLSHLPSMGENQDFQAFGTLLQALQQTASAGLRLMSEPDRPVTDLYAALDEIRVIIEPALHESEVSITWNIAEGLPLVQADHHGLLRLFLNLARNSQRAMENAQEKELVVEATAEDSAVLVRFRDTGHGVADPNQLFQPFQATASETGLGLYISRTIVRSYGGDLRFEPQAVGSCFAIELCAAECGAGT